MLAHVATPVAWLRGRLSAKTLGTIFLGAAIAVETLPSLAQTMKQVLAAPTKASQQGAETPKPAPPAPEPNQPIPLPEVADRAEELDRLLLDFAKDLAPSPEQVAADTSIQEQSAEIAQRAPQLSVLLAGTPSPLELQEEDRYWSTLRQQYTSYRKLLTARAAKLQDQVRVLDEKKTQWQATLAQIKSRKGIEAVVDRVKRVLKDIEHYRVQVQAELNRVLNRQTLVVKQDQQITEAVSKLAEIRTRLRGRLFERDGPPFWKMDESAPMDDSLIAIAYRSANRGFMEAGEFLRVKWLRIIIIIAVYLVALLLTLKFKRDLGVGRFADIPPDAERIFARPYMVALPIALLGTVGQMMTAPSGVLFIVYLLYAIQIVRLTPLLTHRRVLPHLCALAAFSLLEGIYLFIQVSPLLHRKLFVALILAALFTFAWLTRPVVERDWGASDRKLRMALAGSQVGLILLTVSLVANALGFVSLSQIIGVATLLGAFAAVVLYGVVRVLKIMLALILQSWAQSLGPRRIELERWVGVAFALVAVGLWLDTILYLFTIHDNVATLISRALKHPIVFAKVQIIVGDVVNCFLVLLAGYALANVITFVLREFFLSKIELSRGLPVAISTIFYYLLLVLVYLLAVSELGVELNKLTLITGALGIGVGFGLQTTVSNFVSGLILLFERPIRVGDVVEVAGTVGSVRRIGVRSSTIHTADDAEVIVPNNDLISSKVTNWTLSSSKRRVDIRVGIAYGTEPGLVLKLLVGVADSNPEVMRQPKSAAFFLGFGESALNFELQFWSTQERWFQLKSDVAVALAKALADAGIEIPFPQRDLRLRGVEGGVRDALHLASPRTIPPEAEKALSAAQGGRTK